MYDGRVVSRALTFFGVAFCTAVPTANAQRMYWVNAGKDSIQSACLNGTDVENVITGTSSPRGIAIDVEAGKVYWTNFGRTTAPSRIRRANLDGSQIEDLVVTDLWYTRAIAVDHNGGKMYWVGSELYGPHRIQRANLDGSEVEDLVTTGLEDPQDIALDLDAGKMYWTDSPSFMGDGNGKISRANLDGSNVEEVIATGLMDPKGIAIDTVAGKMYWAVYSYSHPEMIRRSNLDGSEIEDIVTVVYRPFGIALDIEDGKVYWVEQWRRGILRANLDGTGTEILVSRGVDAPYHIALDLSDCGGPDCQPNGTPDECDLCDGTSLDCNRNDVPDECDLAAGTSQNCNGNTIPDECELDCNHNDIPDECDIADGTAEDCNSNGVPDECEPDCNSNDVADSCDISAGTSIDCNQNGIPDDCIWMETDCNVNAVPDACDMTDGTSQDCNLTGVPDECEITDGTSQDCNSNGIPDECEDDCNGNGLDDACDIAAGTSADCNENGIPDECEDDCNGNGLDDSCDIEDGTSLDELPIGGDGIPDECQRDCNDNLIPDAVDIAGGFSEDCNDNSVPDECDLADGASADCDDDGVPDECYIERDCPVCCFEDTEHCQSPNGPHIYRADRALPRRLADDFRAPAGGGTINRVCYRHAYWPTYDGTCIDDPPDDDLSIRFYEDAFGLPGTELDGSPGDAAQWDLRSDWLDYRSRCYSAPVEPGVQVDGDACYWIEITGSGRPDCFVYWSESQDGNNYHVEDDSGETGSSGWGYEDLSTSDLAFCIDVGITPAVDPRVDGGCGDIQVACCRYDGSCGEKNLSTCLSEYGTFFPIGPGYQTPEGDPMESCLDADCPKLPPGDDCADAVPMCVKTCQNTTDCALSTRVECETQADCDVVSGGSDTCLPWASCYDNGICGNADTMVEGSVCSREFRDCYDGSPCRPALAGTEVYRCFAVSDNRLAETDGPVVVDDCGPHSPVVFEADVWQKITAPCTGTLVLDECNSLSRHDSLLAIFGDDSAGYADTACPITTSDDLITCNDDFCPGSATVGGFEIPTIKDATYLIRSGGWGDGWPPNEGPVTKNIGFMCPLPVDAEPPALPADARHLAPKNRHISMDLSTNGPNTVAYKVTLSEMNRCSGDTRRACTDSDGCPNICTGDSNLQCSNDGQCGGAGPCVPSGPCVAHSDVGSYWYVDAPHTKVAVPNNDMVGEYMANLVAHPVFRVWSEDTVHVTACEVVPAAAYDVRAMDQISGDESAPLTIATIGKPLGTHYGDVVGIVTGGVFTPPQGVVSVTDVSAYLIANQGGAPGTAPPHTTWVDLHGTQWPEACAGDTCTIPQAILGVSDLGRIKFGFLGQTYVETPGQESPGDCP